MKQTPVTRFFNFILVGLGFTACYGMPPGDWPQRVPSPESDEQTKSPVITDEDTPSAPPLGMTRAAPVDLLTLFQRFMRHSIHPVLLCCQATADHRCYMAGKTEANIVILPLILYLDTFLEVKMVKTRLEAVSANETALNSLISPRALPRYRCPADAAPGATIVAASTRRLWGVLMRETAF